MAPKDPLLACLICPGVVGLGGEAYVRISEGKKLLRKFYVDVVS